MQGRLLVLIMLGFAMILPHSATAAGNEPVVYAFWASSCPHSQKAIEFIRKYRITEPALTIMDFEVDSNLANAAAHARVLERIGISGIAIVPMIIVGENVLIGFETDEVSGGRIRAFVEQCRASGCPDRMSDLIPRSSPQDWAAMTLALPSRECAGLNRTERFPIATPR